MTWVVWAMATNFQCRLRVDPTMNSLGLEENWFPTVTGSETSTRQSSALPSHFSPSLSFSTCPWNKEKREEFPGPHLDMVL